MKKFVCIFIYLSIYLSIRLNGQSINSQVIDEKTSIQRNATYNLEEIKVRWKKAALENCPGVPCIVTPPAPSFTCGTSTVSDIDGNAYATVLIGTQCWTVTNLKVTKYDDGTAIPDQTSISPSSNWGTLQTGARTDYTGATGIPSGQTYVSTYGYLYNWYAVKGIATAGSTTYKNICPTGWHVPTDGEWTSLIQFTVPTETVSATPTGIQSSNAGGKLKSQGTAYWNSPNTGATNESGFSALPGGYRDNVGSFNFIRINAVFWSATETGSISNAWFRDLGSINSNVIRFNNAKSVGASVRCLRD
jgi:uncharacterized protein (TIGR02145 family)